MKKYYWLLMVMACGALFAECEEADVKCAKKSRFRQRYEKRCCDADQARIGIGLGYYAYPAYYDRSPYWYNPYVGTNAYYWQYPNYRSIVADFGYTVGLPIW